MSEHDNDDFEDEPVEGLEEDDDWADEERASEDWEAGEEEDDADYGEDDEDEDWEDAEDEDPDD